MAAISHILVWMAYSSSAAEGAAIAMLAVIFFLTFSIFAAAMVLRKRGRSAPRPEDELLDELNSDERTEGIDKSSKQTKAANSREVINDKPEWERDADWWKNQDD